MSIIIRLQNLPLEANSLDIRRFFQGLQIPDGGVHIVGGENGDAFIAFASDEDARQAMERNGHTIKDSRIKLLLSSRNEMQRVIDLARNQTLGLKPLDAMSTPSANYLSPNLMAIPTASQNVIKANLNNRTGSGSPDRRSMSRESRLRPRSRSRSPLRTERDRPLNGSTGSAINRMGSMHSGIMDTMREPSVHNSFPANDTPIGSRLAYSDAILPSNGLQEGRRQWLPNESLDINPPSDFNRELEIFRDNRSLQRDLPREPNLSDRSYTVEVRNLPFNVSVRDIIDFFNGLFVPEENVKILIDDRGLTTGGALVRFHSEREFDAALSMNRRFLGERQIDVQPLLDSFTPERTEPIPYSGQPLQHSHDINPNVMDRRPVERDLVLYMKGLPYSNCTERDVQKFFEPIKLADVAIEMDPKGRPTGNAFAEFENLRDYDLGMERNLQHMGRRYIELLPTTKEDLLEAKGRGGPPHMLKEQVKTFCVNITGLPATVTNRDLTSYFSNAGAQPYAIHIMLRPNGLNAGEAYVEFGSPESQYCALRLNGDYWLDSRLTIKAVPFEVMRDVVGKPPPMEGPMTSRGPPSRSSRGGRHDDRMRPQHRREREYRRERGGGDPFADNRCVIVATNIPYKASIEDICVFFSDFGITEQCIRRRFNDKGQPTADAHVAFHTPEDASRAVRQMHKKFLIGRPVFLSHI